MYKHGLTNGSFYSYGVGLLKIKAQYEFYGYKTGVHFTSDWPKPFDAQETESKRRQWQAHRAQDTKERSTSHHRYHLSLASTEIIFNTPSGPLYVTVCQLSLHCTLSVSLWNTILWHCNGVKTQSFTFLALPSSQIIENCCRQNVAVIWPEVCWKTIKMCHIQMMGKELLPYYYITAYCNSAIYFSN